MKKNTAHKILNPILLALILNQIATGVFGRELSHEAFEFLHKGGGIVFACLAVVHLVLNFSWVKASYFSKQR
jgi:hypothetical protein